MHVTHLHLIMRLKMLKKSIKCACKIAREAAKGHEHIFIAGDIGPITYNHNDMQNKLAMSM